MERLSGMDASFLYTETPTGHMHVTGVIVIDAAEMSGGYQFERLVDLIQQRLHRLRRRPAGPHGLQEIGHPPPGVVAGAVEPPVDQILHRARKRLRNSLLDG